jgi:chemotaxis protein CheD
MTPDLGGDLRSVNLQPGEVLMSDEPLAVTTILGSCIAVCMFDPGSSRGGICHAALPNAPVVLHKDPFRYVDEAVLYLLERFHRLGTPASRLQVKVFGGADVLGGGAVRDGYVTIGRQNTMAAMETLGWQKVKPSVTETGGDRGRKLVFVTNTGEVYVKRIGKIAGRLHSFKDGEQR